MYYVAKTYKVFCPVIVESFSNYEDAKTYVDIMKRNGKGENYIILTETQK